MQIFLGLESSLSNYGSSVRTYLVKKTSPVLTILVKEPTLVPEPLIKFAQFCMYFYFFALSKSDLAIISSKGSNSANPESVRSSLD